MATFGRAGRAGEGKRGRASSAIGADVASIIKISISRFSLRSLPLTDSAFRPFSKPKQSRFMRSGTQIEGNSARRGRSYMYTEILNRAEYFDD